MYVGVPPPPPGSLAVWVNGGAPDAARVRRGLTKQLQLLPLGVLSLIRDILELNYCTKLFHQTVHALSARSCETRRNIGGSRGKHHSKKSAFSIAFFATFSAFFPHFPAFFANSATAFPPPPLPLTRVAAASGATLLFMLLVLVLVLLVLVVVLLVLLLFLSFTPVFRQPAQRLFHRSPFPACPHPAHACIRRLPSFCHYLMVLLLLWLFLLLLLLLLLLLFS